MTEGIYKLDKEDEKIYRVEIPVLVDVRATDASSAVNKAVEQVVDKGFGLGTQEVKVDYEPFHGTVGGE